MSEDQGVGQWWNSVKESWCFTGRFDRNVTNRPTWAELWPDARKEIERVYTLAIKPSEGVPFLAYCQSCNGEGQYFCHDATRDEGREGYSVNCEDCDQSSDTFPTQNEAASDWNAKQTAE